MSKMLIAVFCMILVITTNSQELVNKTILEWSRQLRTCDSVGDVDVPLTGTTRIVYSFNDNQRLGPKDDNNPQYHTTRGTMNLNFFDASGNANLPVDPQAVEVAPFTASVVLPVIPTYYHCQGFKIDWGTQKRHVIRAEPKINFNNRGVVHHILFMTCPEPLSEKDLQYSGACYATSTPKGNLPDMPVNLSKCDQRSIFAAWAVGGGPVIFPPEAGFPVQGTGYYLMQIHYNNPNLIPSVNDSTGFSFTVTPKLRQYDAACLEFQRLIPSIEIPPGNSSFEVESYADDQLFTKALQFGGMVSPIKIFATFLHSHLLGRKIRVSIFRKGNYIGEVDNNPGYDFNFQQTVMFDPPKLLYSTDTLKLQCIYNSSGRSQKTVGGSSTSEEMCQVYLYYYPATSNPMTFVGSYPADNSQPGIPKTDGIYPNFVEYGLLRQGESTSAATPHLTTPPTVFRPCTTTHSTTYSVGYAGTQYLPISDFNPKLYPNSAILDDLGKYKLYWRVNIVNGTDNGVISFAAEVETSGWVGFGISPSGNMVGSDVVIGWADPISQKVSLLDRKAVAYAQPNIDSSQDVFDVKGYYGPYPKIIPAKNPLYYFP